MTTEHCNDLRTAKKINDGETFDRIVRWPVLYGGTDCHPLELMEALVAHPNCVRSLALSWMPDEAGGLIGQFISQTETLEKLSFAGNKFDKRTYWSIAGAFYVNTSISDLRFTDSRTFLLDKDAGVVQAFNAAFIANPRSPLQRVHEDLFRSSIHYYDYYSVKKDSQQ